MVLRKRSNKTAYEEDLIKQEKTDDCGDSGGLKYSNERRTYHRLKSSVVRQVLLTVSALLLAGILIFSMSVAWFTNVSKTSDMQFATGAWGFDKNKITVLDTSPKIFPGKSGVIPLSIDNSRGDTNINAMVTVDKSGMAATRAASVPDINGELAKRIYFYIDTARTYSYGGNELTESLDANDDVDNDSETGSETVSRIYINSRDGYCYSVSQGCKLCLSEEYCNDVQLKWEWVNDVQGYYFRGTVSERGAEAAEYLRPVTYSPEAYAVSYDEFGQLAGVNGKDRAEFIAELTSKDGFEGTVDAESEESYVTVPISAGEADEEAPDIPEKTQIYYKISVDADGKGIWLYLCTEEEIAKENEIDNRIGAELEISAKVIVTAASIAHTEKPVGSAEELEAALNSPADEDNFIKLSADVSVSEPILLAEGMNKLIDLNKHSITYAGTETAYSVVTVPSGSTLTLLHGTLIGNGNQSASAAKTDVTAVQCSGGTVTLSGISAQKVDTAVMVDDRLSGDSVVKITGCIFNTGSTAVVVKGNGDGSAEKTKVMIENSKLTSGYIGICGNGSDDQWGTEIVLIDDLIEGAWAGIYCPQRQSQMTVVNCEVTGYTGIAVKGGCVELYDSTVTGTGEYTEAGASGGGWTDTGDALYVEAAYDWSASAVVRGSGNTLISEYGYCVQLYNADGKGPGMLTVEGGTLDEYGKDPSKVGDFGILTMPQREEPEEAQEG